MSNRASHKSRSPISLYCVAIALALAVVLPVASVDAGMATGQPELATIVRCDPTMPTGALGVSDAVVDIYIEDVVGLNAVDIRVSFFDTTIAQVLDQLPAPGVQIQPLYTFLQPDFPASNTVNNTTGTIRYAVTQVFPNLPVTGSGPVARITFQGQQAGAFTMTWGAIELSDINGQLIGYTAQPCTVTFTNPLAVTLNSFEASAQADHVLVAWETVSEVSNSGFNLYRSQSADGPRQMLNAALIPSQNPGATQGAAYRWQDFAVRPDEVYYYWLEDVSLSGATTIHGPVSVQFAAPTAVTLDNVSAHPVAAAPLSWFWVIAGAGVALALSHTRRRIHG
jgi:hypothetical protein